MGRLWRANYLPFQKTKNIGSGLGYSRCFHKFQRLGLSRHNIFKNYQMFYYFPKFIYAIFPNLFHVIRKFTKFLIAFFFLFFMRLHRFRNFHYYMWCQESIVLYSVFTHSHPNFPILNLILLFKNILTISLQIINIISNISLPRIDFMPFFCAWA